LVWPYLQTAAPLIPGDLHGVCASAQILIPALGSVLQMNQYQIAVIVGSLRRESLNRKLATAIVKLAPPEFTFRQVQVGDLPLYNQDDDTNQAPPVRRLKAEIAASQGLLFVTPEYNRSIPGVLKNAVDHASRPHGQNAWAGKPAGVLGISPGAMGTSMGLEHITTDGAYDHILFVALVVVAFPISEWKKIILLITGFTIGHSVSLLLSVCNIFVLNQSIAEYLIISTILVTALFHLYSFRQITSKNTRILFFLIPLFGGIHGMGFSYVLRSMLGTEGFQSLPLLYFNLGIELGQLIIVLLVVLFYLLLRTLFKVHYKHFKLSIACISVLFSIVILAQRLL
jgi:chromate reductase